MTDSHHTPISDIPDDSGTEGNPDENTADDPVFHWILSAIEEELDKLSEERRDHAQAFSSPLDAACHPTETADAASASPEPVEPERGTSAYDRKHGIPRF